jgi:CDP-glucose 4,6-dehydratase
MEGLVTSDWSSLAGRSVLVTGHTGLMGSWLALWLDTLGAQVTGYGFDPPSQPNHFDAAQIHELLADDVRGDIRDSDALTRTVRGCAPDIIFHLAAQPLVLRGLSHPRETFDVNVLGTATLCDAVRAAGSRCSVVVATSDKCYRNDGQARAFEEADPLGGHDPYSASKAGAELVVGAYRSSYFPPNGLAEHGVDLTTVRAGNVIGGGDWAADRLVPDAVRALSSGHDLVVRNPNSTRPWQHVLEPLSGYLSVATRSPSMISDPSIEPAWNFGPLLADAPSAGDIAAAVVKHWGSGRWTTPDDAPKTNEAATLRISIDKARIELGWSPRWDFERAVAETIEWYRAFYENESGSVRELSLGNIEAYGQSMKTASPT